MSQKREIALLTCQKGLEDLKHTTDVRLAGMHSLKSLPEGACQLDSLLDAIKHPSDDI